MRIFQIFKPYLMITFAIVLYYLLATSIFGYVSPTMIFFGLPCPACGMTRAGLLFLTFNFAESFRMHPLFVPAAVFIIWYIICSIFWPGKHRRVQIPAAALFISLIAVYIYRMVYMFPYYPPMIINENSILHNIISLITQNGT